MALLSKWPLQLVSRLIVPLQEARIKVADQEVAGLASHLEGELLDLSSSILQLLHQRKKIKEADLVAARQSIEVEDPEVVELDLVRQAYSDTWLKRRESGAPTMRRTKMIPTPPKNSYL